MRLSFQRLWAAALVVAGVEAAGAATPAAGCFSDVVRISALVNLGAKVKVGIVDIATTNSYFVGAGQMAGPVEVVAIDYDKEEVTLRRGGTTCVLRLAADPNAPAAPEPIHLPGSPLYRGDAIERFLKENPGAVEKGLIKFPLVEVAPVAGRGETIEKFLRDNPEAARIANMPAEGKGEGIEKFLRDHPEIKVDDTPIPEGSLGPGIEAAMKNNPLILTNQLVPPPAPPAP